MRAILFSSALVVVAACQSSPTDGEAPAAATVPGVTDATIKIGTYGPLSGPAEQWGLPLKAMQAYFDYVNSKGGVHGRKLELLIKDDGYDATKTPRVVQELVESDQVFAIVGGVGTSNGRAVAQYVEKNGVPFFSPASGDDFWTDPIKPNVYTVYPRYRTEGQILGEYIARELRSLKVGALYQEDDFGKQGVAGIEAGLERFKGKLLFKVACQPTDEDLSQQVAQIIANKPEVLVIFTGPKQAVTAVKMLSAKKARPHILTSFVLGDSMMFDLAGKEAWEGTITSSAVKLATSDDPSVVKYREVLAAHGKGLRAGAFTLGGFAIATPFVEALERAGKDLTREKLYESLNTLKNYDGAGPYWNGGALGPAVTFGADDRLGSDQIFFAKAVDGEWQRVSDWIGLNPDAPPGG